MDIQEKSKQDKLMQSRAKSIKEDINNNSERWDEKNEGSKNHGDKEQLENSKVKGQSNSPASNYTEEDNQDTQNLRDDANAEYVDHQDLNETNDDDFQQPQPMSQDLSSIYPGRASSREEREQLAEERQRKMTAQENRRSNSGQHQQGAFPESRSQMGWKDNQDNKRYMDTERGNYARHRDYQDRQGRERNRNLEDEYPSEERNRYTYKPDRYEGQGPERHSGQPHPYGDTPSWEHEEYRNHIRQGGKRRGMNEYRSRERDPNFPSARQNEWDDNMTDYRGYEETDYDDREVRRRRDEGMQPWDSEVDYDSDYDRRDYYREGRGRFDERQGYGRDYSRGYGRPDHYRDDRRRRREDYPENYRPGNYDRWRRGDYSRDFREEDYDRDYDRYDSRNMDRNRRRYRRDDW